MKDEGDGDGPPSFLPVNGESGLHYRKLEQRTGGSQRMRFTGRNQRRMEDAGESERNTGPDPYGDGRPRSLYKAGDGEDERRTEVRYEWMRSMV